ncbi:DUF602-domain-containing protein [Eremomyces bilateralis CBS 781.70]|uniref:DUF602-domain-containing protein n=1 Tax=Eremomyces bilateralis CBS 781.70 TaxID=1392243 RepID=A0A6G1G4D4_9PEZI|nr:DUF602-domain-containing protein [Eremomyces bilateralis CBS 781.70]KAF1812852.1 DUF602-domain-containing protein [Eremomyces bilateralis CBS 781.70]
MGNDGGSIPTRRELVKEAAKTPTTTQLKERAVEAQSYGWSTDPLSRKPLQPPIVSDASGKLYNKDSVLEHLLSANAEPGSLAARRREEAETILEGRVNALRDVVGVKLEERGDGEEKRFVCPISDKVLGPGTKCVYIVPCGHAFSAVAVKEVAGEKCLVCNEPYAPNDIIPILPTDPLDLARLSLRVKILKERGLSHSLKKLPGSKKRKQAAAVAATAADSDSALKSSTSTTVPDTDITPIHNASTRALASKVLSEQDLANKRRKLQKNENLESLFSNRGEGANKANTKDFMTRGFSIPAGAKRT